MLTFSTSPGCRSFSIISPSTSRNIIPLPSACCSINPSPPNNPALNFLVSATLVCTPFSAQRKAPFWNIIPFGLVFMSTGRTEPGTVEANPITALSVSAV